MRDALLALGRGALKRCPRCGAGHLFQRWFTMAERCPRCGLRFAREEGHWVGAMIVNIAVAEVVFVVMLVAVVIATAPDIPVVPLTIGLVVINAAVPILFYPWSKTIWVAIDILMHRVDREDRGIGGNGEGAREILRGR